MLLLELMFGLLIRVGVTVAPQFRPLGSGIGVIVRVYFRIIVGVRVMGLPRFRP